MGKVTLTIGRRLLKGVCLELAAQSDDREINKDNIFKIFLTFS